MVAVLKIEFAVLKTEQMEKIMKGYARGVLL
jgi:hypothetical protein